MKALTDQQERVLVAVSDHLTRNGFPPTLRELGDALGLSNPNAVRGHLIALQRKGYIDKDPDKARSIRVIRGPSRASRFKRKLHEVFHTDRGVHHRIVYGLAWTTWRRQPLFEGEAADWLAEALEQEAAEHGWRIIDKRIARDHVRLIVEVWPNHSPQSTVRRFQAAGSALKRHRPRAFPGRRLWADGFAATTDPNLMDALVDELLSEGEMGGDI